ncbi:MAG: hypothetical protein ABI742_00520 [Gemmatimonadota bacterium]
MNPRPIAPAEADLVRWLLARAGQRAGADALATQVAGLLVASQCDCGCPSVDFLVEGLSATASIVAEAEGRAPDGTLVGVILWARADRLSGLEVYALGDSVTGSLPRPEDLHPSSAIGAR